jgi:hypothetical protein
MEIECHPPVALPGIRQADGDIIPETLGKQTGDQPRRLFVGFQHRNRGVWRQPRIG